MPSLDRSSLADSPNVIAPPTVAVHRGRGATVVAWLALGAFGVVFGLVQARRSDAIDLAITVKLQGRSHPTVGALMERVSWPGFPPQSRVIPAAIAATLFAARLRLESIFLLGAWGTAFVSTVIKAVTRRPRPLAGVDLRVVTAPLGGSSFPSGHTFTYVGVYGFLAFLAHTLIRPVAVRRAVVGGLLGLVVLVGPSRIHEGHHWFTDVVASYLLGLAYLIGLTSLYRRVKARRSGVPR